MIVLCFRGASDTAGTACDIAMGAGTRAGCTTGCRTCASTSDGTCGIARTGFDVSPRGLGEGAGDASGSSFASCIRSETGMSLQRSAISLYDPVDASDKLSCRPDFAVIAYPGYLALSEQNYAPNPDIHPTAQTPPTFIVQAEDDTVHVENAVVYFMALKNAKVPAELHIYAQGGHGYGLRRTELPVTTWPRSVEIWLHTIHVLPATN